MVVCQRQGILYISDDESASLRNEQLQEMKQQGGDGSREFVVTQREEILDQENPQRTIGRDASELFGGGWQQ